MHLIQKQIIDLLASGKDLGSMSLRSIAKLIGAEGKPQTAKYHLQQLDQNGLINMNLSENVIKLVKKGKDKASVASLFSLPIVGSANCGPATMFADDNVDQYLKVSSSMLPSNKTKGIYAVIADGDSMNKAKVYPESDITIESGDYVLVDKDDSSYQDGDIVIAVVEGLANIKRYRKDATNNRIILESESTSDYLPIFIHQGDSFTFSGKVVGVIKKN
jgi:SOS-response transcriptional repressor LexA